MRFLLGSIAHNSHVQNMGVALHEAGMLGEFHASGVDVWHGSLWRGLRGLAGSVYPGLDAKLARRRITDIPETLITSEWGWEAASLMLRRMGPLVGDSLWEKSEHALDRHCARKMTGGGFDAFLGIEHGALAAIQKAKLEGKPAGVAFLSPHHATRARWVDSEYERFPELLTPATRALLEKGRLRDARRDQEAQLADFIHCASRFVHDSLVEGGVAAEKIFTCPLGCPPAVDSIERGTIDCGAGAPQPVRFLYAGPVSVRKGAHVLLEAWKRLGNPAGAELHFFGVVTLPERCLRECPEGVHFHGSVSFAQMEHEYQAASILVFPTLCDGFGLVASEALAHGLPVLTTPNAGASQLIREGRNGFLVPPHDPDALAVRMQWCMDHPAQLEEMREAARTSAHEWTWADYRKSFVSQLAAKLGVGAAAPFQSCER
jgi:glycosyltransferase involved in cell wall biosynthesis